MKTRFLAVLALSVLSITQNSHAARESTHGFGLGFILGDPTAITAKQYLDHNQAFDLGFGYDWGHSVMLYGDYLFHFPGGIQYHRDADQSHCPLRRHWTKTRVHRFQPSTLRGPQQLHNLLECAHPSGFELVSARCAH